MSTIVYKCYSRQHSVIIIFPNQYCNGSGNIHHDWFGPRVWNQTRDKPLTQTNDDWKNEQTDSPEGGTGVKMDKMANDIFF